MAIRVNYPQITSWASQAADVELGASGRQGLVPGALAQPTHLNAMLSRGAHVVEQLKGLPYLNWRLLGLTTGTGAMTGMVNSDTGPLLLRDNEAWRLLANGVGPSLSAPSHTKMFPAIPFELLGTDSRAFAFLRSVAGSESVGIRRPSTSQRLGPVDDGSSLIWNLASIHNLLNESGSSAQTLLGYDQTTEELVIFQLGRMYRLSPNSANSTVTSQLVMPDVDDVITAFHINELGDTMVAGISDATSQLVIRHRPAGGSWGTVPTLSAMQDAPRAIEIWYTQGRWGMIHDDEFGFGSKRTRFSLTDTLTSWFTLQDLNATTGYTPGRGAQIGNTLVTMSKQNSPLALIPGIPTPGIIAIDLLTARATYVQLSFVDDNSDLWADEHGLVITNSVTQTVHVAPFVGPVAGARVT